MLLRKAQRPDCKRLLELVKELAIYEKAPEEVTVTLQEMEEAGFGAKPVWEALVAEENGVIVGFALYYTRYSTWKGCRMYLEDFIVTEQERGKGTGKMLFDALIKECKAQGFQGMVWQVLDWNEPAINFYKKYAAHLDPEWINGSLTEQQISEFENS